MTTRVDAHPWSDESLFAKAVLYAERMDAVTPDDWQCGFWSALTLELLARAGLAKISPLLLADTSNWRNITYAMGRDPTVKKFSPTSVSTKEVLSRLSELVPTFTEEIAGFCTQHTERRNSELHTGQLVFDSLGTSAWLPRFYQACSVLLEHMGKELADLFAEAESAAAMIESLKDETAKAVRQDITAHAKVWANKAKKDQAEALTQATAWASRQAGHRVDCPACKCPALVHGQSVGEVKTAVGENEVIQRQAMLPSAFECVACGLHVAGLSRLSSCGLGDAFSAKTTYSAADFFGLYTADDLEEARNAAPEYEEDFNEYE